MGLSQLQACSDQPVTLAPVEQHRLVNEPLIDGVLSINGQLAVTLGRSRDLIVWDLVKQEIQHQWSADAFPETLYLVALSGNRRYLAATGKHQLFMFDLETGQLEVNWQAQGFNPHASISSLAVSHTGDNVLVGMNDGSIMRINRTSQRMSLFKMHDSTVNYVQFYENYDKAISASGDGTAVQWTAVDGKIINSFTQPQGIAGIGFNEQDFRLFITDTLDNNAIVDIKSGQTISQLNFMSRYRYFRHALFMNQGNTLITATSKQHMFSWNVETGQETSQWQITAFSAGTTVLSMATNHQGNLITLSSDAAVETWKL